MEPKDRLIIPLDVPTLEEARALVEKLGPYVGLFKVGMELFHSEGPAVVQMVNELHKPPFLDEKFHDIPNTVAGASAAVTRLGIKMFNVHALGGKDMMAKALASASATATALNLPCPLVLGVTILTSIDESILLDQMGIGRPLEEQALRLAQLAQEAGLDGVVASALEAPLIKAECGESFIVVCPGIRPAGTSVDDQVRTVTPRLARESGADYIVVGRPITKAADPVVAAQRVVEELAEADANLPV